MQRFYFLMLILFTMMSCQQHGKIHRISTLGSTAESVYVTHDQYNNPVIAWTEMDADKINFFYAISTDEGKSFSEKINIPVPDEISTHAEGMPKVAFKEDGTVIAAYEKKTPTIENKYAGAIFYRQSTDNGKIWSDARFIHSDTIAGRSRSFFDIQTLPNGEVGAAWLDIKVNNKVGGRSIRFAKTEHQKGFSHEMLIDSSACECCRIDLYTDITKNINIAYRGLMKGNIGQSIRDIMHTTSSDGGTTFSIPLRISDDNWIIDGCPHTGPSLGSNKQGLHALWYTEGGNRGIYYAYTEKVGDGFTPREQISTYGHHPQIGAYNDRIAIVWEEAFGGSATNSNRIHYQLRNGMNVTGGSITPEESNAYLPVIMYNRDKFIIAFLMEDINGTGAFFISI
jgi:hypothetical protein